MSDWLGRVVRFVVGDQRYFRWRMGGRFRAAVRRGRPVIFVHQMGKVGSLSVLRELKRKRAWGGPSPAVYHTHFLSEPGVRFLRDLQAAGHGGWGAVPAGSRRHIAESRALSDIVRSGFLGGAGCRVVSLVRDPVAVDLSSFFHNVAWWPARLRAHCDCRASGWRDRLLGHFLERFPHDMPLHWFDDEMAPVFGIDVFESEFPSDLGYRIYERDRVRLLVLKLEMLDTAAPAAFRQFLGIGDFALRRENTASGKPHGDLYREFLSGLSLPSEYLDRMYRAKVSRHFYGEAEIAAFRKKWSGNRAG